MEFIIDRAHRHQYLIDKLYDLSQQALISELPIKDAVGELYIRVNRDWIDVTREPTNQQYQHKYLTSYFIADAVAWEASKVLAGHVVYECEDALDSVEDSLHKLK